MASNSSSQLAQFIDEVPNFPKPGILFRDISPLLRNHFNATIDALSALYTDEDWKNIDTLAGIESRGFIFAAALAYKHQKGFVKVRKPGKLPNVHASIEYGLEYGKDSLHMQKGDGSRILILDDLIATGGSLQATCKLCEEVGYNIAGLACVIDLTHLNNFNYNGHGVRSIIQYSD
ncbi:adenine phosphoribosyltransferase [Thiomicrospira cyclica]|jgi:adenine phosphoribosyltransferase|uniref:Adenine phosphoribosyltransferase n=1 Tax=Thiomicrospira cyclica (strain DSM 14477 / JCM 11371 / ALM1) TaxID=717773 RepID=F6DBJ6_THICA|nr:adenine phosphoribosyltransferase [Thiomicrospira cyclica]AEG32398.1 Adenine phosphoribosyltransferase [Thiomicrospira cyclica ALM1]